MSKTRALIVDDHAPSLRALAEALRNGGLRVETAADADAALASARTFAPEVLVLDADLPPDGGPAFLQRAREGGALTESRVVYLLPPACPPERARRCEDAGDACLRKPVRLAELRERVLEVAASSAPPKAESGADGPSARATAATPPDEEALRGRSFGGCRVERLLGRGGMGVVYLGRHEMLDTPVAIKLLPVALVRWDPDQLDRFLRGARAAARIEHPNVAAVLHAGEEVDFYYLITRYLEGSSLHEILAERKRLEIAESVRVLRDTASGLDAAHRLGVVHRDVKPSNIIIAPEGDARLTDFGLSRSEGDSSVTSTGVIVGTPFYMAPEQCEGRPTDAASDLYSLGATIYHCLTGRRPAEGAAPVEVLRRQVEEPPEPIRVLRPETPPPLIRLVNRMMEKAPEGRPASAREVVEEAERLGAL